VLLDVAKESSDWFPPFKSCLGGINALIKHYDVCSCRTIPLQFTDEFLQEIQDMKDKLEDLVPRVTKLQDSLTGPNTSGDLEEVERQTQLTRFVSNFYSLATLNQSPVGPWMTLRSGLRHCRGRERCPGLSTRHGTRKPSSGSSTSSRKRSSSTKCVLRTANFDRS